VNKSIPIVLLTFAVLAAVVMAAGCVSESTSSESTPGNFQAQQAEESAGSQSGAPDENVPKNETMNGDLPLTPPSDMPMDGNPPNGAILNGTPPTDMPMDANSPPDMPKNPEETPAS
jgi:hypothetical protein